MKRFNGNKAINKTITDKIQTFFEYKWKYDKNLGISTENEIKILDQLPDDV